MATLRSNFEPGTTRWAVRRAQWRALGISEADLTKPKIAVVNSSSGLSSCYMHLDALSAVVQAAIRDAGGLAFEIRTAAPSDFVTSAGREGRYLMPTRDLIVNDIEVMVEGAVLDGMVCLSSCDKTTPAHLMAAGRLDVPTLIVIGGYQVGGRCGGRFVDIDDVYESVGALRAGSLPLAELTRMADCAIGGPGVCAGLGTANSMHMVAEALGMTLPGAAPVRAASGRADALASASGQRIVEMVHERLRPRDIITEAAIENAVTLAAAVGCSVNVVRHLSAIATEAGLDTDVIGCFERLAPEVPLLCAVRPNGPYRTEDLEAAGGARGVIRHLAPLLHGHARTATGTVADALAASPPPIDTDLIRPLDDPVAPTGGLMIIRGSLAPGGAIIKTAAVATGRRRLAGPARVFANESAAMEALAQGAIRDGDVVVLRGLGPRGGPGTMFAAGFVAALVGAGLSDEVAVVTDGELSGLNRGLTIGQVMPEAADDGPLAIVVEGDEIVIDLDAARIDLAVDSDEVAARFDRLERPTPERVNGWLEIYGSLVQPIAHGATLLPRARAPERSARHDHP